MATTKKVKRGVLDGGIVWRDKKSESLCKELKPKSGTNGRRKSEEKEGKEGCKKSRFQDQAELRQAERSGAIFWPPGPADFGR